MVQNKAVMALQVTHHAISRFRERVDPKTSMRYWSDERITQWVLRMWEAGKPSMPKDPVSRIEKLVKYANVDDETREVAGWRFTRAGGKIVTAFRLTRMREDMVM